MKLILSLILIALAVVALVVLVCLWKVLSCEEIQRDALPEPTIAPPVDNDHVSPGCEQFRQSADRAREELAKAQAALAELIKSVNECDRDHDLPPLTADFGKGWISPDEAAKLRGELEAAEQHVKILREQVAALKLNGGVK